MAVTGVSVLLQLEAKSFLEGNLYKYRHSSSATLFISDKDCDLRIQLPYVNEKQMKIEIDKDGNVKYILYVHSLL